MLIQLRTITVEKGHAHKVVERFAKPGPIDGMEGLADITVMVNRNAKEQEEVTVMIRWQSVDAWKDWEKSDAHREGHKRSRSQSRPDYIIDSSVRMYDVAAVKEGRAHAGRSESAAE